MQNMEKERIQKLRFFKSRSQKVRRVYTNQQATKQWWLKDKLWLHKAVSSAQHHEADVQLCRHDKGRH